MVRYRKFAPLDRDSPIIEVVEGDDILFDISLDEGATELAFHSAIAGRVFELNNLLSLVDGARRNLDN